VKNAILQFIVALLFILLSVLDYFWFFVFHPFQLAIVVDLEEKSANDRALLRKLAIESEIENSNNNTLRKSFGDPNRNRISLNINQV
jgi:hypothetical protein